ncbi:MAG: hypothetical protein ACLFVT_07745 [Syntrophobacteria bacterium]
MDYNDRMIIKTVESPCRTCPRRNEDRELCMRDCPKLKAFQEAMVHLHEEKINWFSSRLRAA